MSLLLKFWVKVNGGQGYAYIETEAGENEDGDWQDNEYVYLENGVVPKELICNEVETEWLESYTKDVGVASQPQLLEGSWELVTRQQGTT